jgi:hypothetical protein
MKTSWHTAWHGQDIVVYRDDVEVDRIASNQIERVILVHRDSGYTPNDLLYAVVELADEHLVFPADTGFAGRVNFERHAFWAERACTYWVNEARAQLPLKLRRGWWFLGHSQTVFARLPRTELAGLIDSWPVQGPQTWEQRKWYRIEANRPFAREPDAQLHA